MQKSKKVELKLPTLIIDNQDGGFSAVIFPTDEARLASINEDLEEDDEDRVTQEQMDSGDYDEYQHGYSGTTTIKLAVNAKGNISLAEEVRLHGGQ